VGANLPLDIHYAIGNFIRDGIQGKPIIIQSDGTPVRSYQYTADTAVWLWTMLLKGQAGRIYNVGSEAAYSIEQVAHLVADCFSHRPEIQILKTPDPSKLPERYVPSTKRARSELHLEETIGLKEALPRTIHALQTIDS
jgi:dTDP-glucose 4,6-dehydratase